MVDGYTEKVGFGFEITDEASRPLSKIEQSYAHATKGVERAMGDFAKYGKSQSEVMQDATEAMEDSGEEEKKKTGRLQEMTGKLGENIVGLDKFGISWSNIGKILTGVSLGAAIVGIISFLTVAVKKAAAFRRTLAELNEAYSMNAKEGAIVASTLFGLQDRAGRTRDEVGSLVRAMLELGHTPEVLKKTGTSFRDLATDILDFSSATGMGMDASAQFADQLIRINKIPANRIRNIGNAIKYVADNTRISADELVAFNQGLEPLMDRLGPMSGEAREEFTANMMGLAGALSDIRVDAGKATSEFGDMLNRSSVTGVEALNKLSTFTQIGGEELRAMIRENPAQVFDEMAAAAARMDPRQLEHMAEAVKPLGMSLGELNRLGEHHQKVMMKEAKTLVILSKEAAIQAKDGEALARKAAKRQEMLAGITARLGKMMERVYLKVGTAVTKYMIEPFSKELIPLLEDFSDWIARQDWETIFRDVGGAIREVVTWFKEWEKISRDVGFELDQVSKSAGSLNDDTSQMVRDYENYMRGIGTSLGDALAVTGDWIKSKWDWLTSPQTWKDFKNYIKAALKSVRIFMVDFIDKIWETIKKVGKFATDLFGGGIEFLVSQVAGEETGKRTGEFLQKSIGGMFEPTEPSRRSVGETVVGGVEKGAERLAAVGSELVFPSKMTTSSPAQEKLLTKQNILLERIAHIISGGGVGGAKSTGAAAARERELAARAEG